MNLATFRAILKSEIKKKGYKQDEFAEKIGIGLSTLKKYMSGSSTPDIEIFDRMCKALDCDYDYLMGKIDTPHKAVYDVKEVTGLSEQSCNILIEAHDNSKPLVEQFSHDVREHLIKSGVLDSLDYEKANNKFGVSYKEKLAAIDFMIKKSQNNLFLNYISMYLFSDFTVENGNIPWHDKINLKDKNNGFITHFNPNLAKEALLTKVTYQLQKWREEIERVNR